MEELKIFIDNAQKAEEQIVAKGAVFTQEVFVTDTYFNQPEGFVLKLTEDDRGYFLTQLQAEAGGFKFIKQEKIEDLEITKKQLTEQFGIKCILKKKRRFFDFGKYMINLNLFEDIGNFLIIEGKTVTKDVIEEELGFENPKYLTISFDKLKEQQQK